MQYSSLTSKDKARLFAQAKQCCICLGKSKTSRLVTDHCHTSGEVRAVLCEKCNSWLGVFESTNASEKRKTKVARRIKSKYGIERFTFEHYLNKYEFLKKQNRRQKRTEKRKEKKNKAKGNSGIRNFKYMTLPNDMENFKAVVSVSLED